MINAILSAAQLHFNVEPSLFANTRARTSDTVDARACACWVLKARGLKLKEIAVVVGYADEQRPMALIQRVNATPRLLDQAARILAAVVPQ